MDMQKRINDFFENLTTEELENMLVKAGIDEIKSASEFGMEMFNCEAPEYSMQTSKNIKYENGLTRYEQSTKLLGAA